MLGEKLNIACFMEEVCQSTKSYWVYCDDILYRHLFPLITLTTAVSIHPIVWFITKYLRTRGCCTRGCWSINIMKSSATLQLRGKKPFLSVCAFLSWNVPRDDAMHTSQTQSQCQRAEMWCSNAKGGFH